MAGDVLNIKAFSPLKLRSGLTGKCHAICHYSYNLPLSLSVKPTAQMAHLVFPTHIANTKPKEPFFPTHYNIIQKRLLTLTIIGQVQIQAMTLGQKIRELRQQAGLKQREVAYQLGIGEGYLSKVENEHKPLKREDLIKLGKLFKVPIEDLESLWLASKVYSIVRDEENALSALKVAEEQIKYNNLNNA